METGNTHTLKFTPAQADQFIATYEVLAQFRNDSLLPGKSGFSGTLFKKRATGELTLSIRSTEFFDDAVRDSKATNALELKDLGWALGQIAELEEWYNELRGSTALLADGNGGVTPFNVTGYSLGGHLATAFNILRREEAQATGAPNPIIATYTFNASGTGGILNNRRLTDIIADFKRIRADYTASPEWMGLTPIEARTYEGLAQSRVDAIAAEYARTTGIKNLNPSFGQPGPPGDQIQFGHQIAALLVARDTEGMLNANYPTDTSFLPIAPTFAPSELQFGNMIEVVGMEYSPLALASSFISNSGIHYGTRQEIHIENQPLYRGNWAVEFFSNFPHLLVDNPHVNNFADPHSLTLLVDSLAVMAAMERIAPQLPIETAGDLYAAMSNKSAFTFPLTQGKAEGDTLERMLDALSKMVLGPSTTRTLTDRQMQDVLVGNTWHEELYRLPFHARLNELRNRIEPLVSGTGASLTLDSLLGVSAGQLTGLAQAPGAVAYRYALKELNPFALTGDPESTSFYGQHNANGQLDLHDPIARTGDLTAEWIVDRAAFQSWKDRANLGNTIVQVSAAGSEMARFVDRPQSYVLPIVPSGAGVFVAATSRQFVFGGDGDDDLRGGPLADRLYGSGGSDYLAGNQGADYLEGGKGLDVYQYNASAIGAVNDGADVIRDIDGGGSIRYRYRSLSGLVASTILGEASLKLSASEWRSLNGKFIYNKVGGDLLITINGDAGGTITIRDFRNGDLGIHLRDPRDNPANPLRLFIGDKQDYDADPIAEGIQTETDGFGNVTRADGLDGRPDIAWLEREDLFYGSAGDGEIEYFQLGEGNDQALADGNALYPASGGIAWMQGGGGRDMLHGGLSANLIEGGSGGILDGEIGGDIAFGGFGDDEIHGDAKLALDEAIAAGDTDAGTGIKGDFLSGAPGDDWLIASATDDFLDGGSGDDVLIGGAGDDNIAGDYGYGAITPLWQISREILTQGGTDLYHLLFGFGISLLDTAPAGSDVIYAGAGNDWVFGNGGDDFVDAGPGNDVVFGEAGTDTLAGGDGGDRLVGDNPGTVLAADEAGDFLDGGAGNDELHGNGGGDVLAGGGDDDLLFGGAGADILLGDEGDDILVGDHPGVVAAADEGADQLDGGEGNDTLHGDGGDDVLAGGPGDDVLHGGAGRDTYVFNRGDGADTVFDTDTSADHPDASILMLGDDIERADIRFGIGSLLIDLGNGDRIHIGGFDQITPANSAPLAGIRLADGTFVTYDEILAQGFDIVGTDGDDNSQPGAAPNLVGTGVVDRIHGLAGDDVLFGLVGDDLLDGGDGDDSLVGGAGADSIDGGAGADAIWGGGDNGGVLAADAADIIHAGAGDDHIEGGDGEDQIFGEEDIDTIYGQAGADTVDGGDGNDSLYGDGLYFVIDRFVANLFDDGAADTLRGGGGSDYLNGGAGDDLLEGGSGDDVLAAESGNDTLDGGEGNDVLQGGAGDDVLAGGPGSDSLQGQAGNDIYLFEAGDGEDVLLDQSDGTLDILRFGSTIAVTDIAFAHGAGSALVAWHIGGGSQVTIENWYLAPANELDHFEFADASRITPEQAEAMAAASWRGGSGNDALSGGNAADTLAGLGGSDVISAFAGDDTLIGGPGDDILSGGAGADTYLFSLGDGSDLVAETDQFLNNVIRFDASVAGTDVAFARIGADLVLAHVNGVDRVVVDNWFAPTNWYLIETVAFDADGATYTRGEIRTAATVIPHAYTLDLGDGAMLIEDWGGTDTLTFGAGIAKADIVLSRADLDLRLAHVNGSDHVTIAGWFDSLARQIESVAFSATGESFTHDELTDPFLVMNGTAGSDALQGGDLYGETINGLAGNDVIHGRGGQDTITGGPGNDTIYGGLGLDRFHFRGGDGIDVITEEGSEGGVLQLAPGMLDVMTLDAINGGWRLTFAGSTDTIDLIRTGFGTIEIKGELNGTSSANALVGNDLFGDVIQGLGGNDTIQGRGGNDEISGGTGNDTIDGGDGNDQLWGNEGDDVIDGGPPSSTGGIDRFFGGPGNDTLYGGSQIDRFHYERGDGLDLIIDEPRLVGSTWFWSQSDQLIFGADIGPESLAIAPSGNDLLVTLSPSERITIRNGLSDPGYRVDEFVFADGSLLDSNEIMLLAYTQRGTSGDDTLTGTSSNDALYGLGGNDTLIGSWGDDVLDGGPGNDTLDGGSGNDRYVFGPGSGQDRIIDVQGSDAVEFGSGVTASQIVLGRSLNSLVLAIAGTADTLTIQNFLADPSARIESFAFADGSLLPDTASIVDGLVGVFGTAGDDALQGTDGFDILYGFAGNDTLTALGDDDVVYGGSDDDILTGGSGNDNLQGEAGDDTYLYAPGGGFDVIADTAGTDVVAFGAGIGTSAVAATRSGSNLVLTVNVPGSGGSVTVANYFAGQETETIRFADGTTWDVAMVRNKVLAASATSGNDLILGFESDDTINSLAGNDTVYGGAGNDVIDGGTGSDTLHGEDGNDVISAGTGDAKNATIVNRLYGGNGDDVLVAGGKTDTLAGESGNDVALGAGGADTLEESAGSNFLFGAAGADALRSGDGNDLTIGGTGNDTIDGDPDADSLRGRDIVAFNKSDGVETVSRLGSGSTLSIGGGTVYSNLSFAVSGSNLLLKTSSSNYVALVGWYGAAGEKNVSTLQIVIEGTNNYNANSSNPLNNRKIQTFDFPGLVSAYDAAGRPSNFSIANHLAAHRIAGSDTAAIGGALAYQYARTGTLGTLTYAQMQSVVRDPVFGAGAQSIVPSATAFATISAMSDIDANAAEEPPTAPALRLSEAASPTTAETAQTRPAASNPEHASTGVSIPASPRDGVPPLGGDGTRGAAHDDRPLPPDDLGTSRDTSPTAGEDTPAAALVAEWFDADRADDDLSLLDDILRGDDGVRADRRSPIAAAWERTHRWLERDAQLRVAEDMSDAGAGLPVLAHAGFDSTRYDMPRGTVGLSAVAGHDLTVFRGLSA